MGSAWWVGENELDNDQRNVISLGEDENALIIGPPGSGKTNLLLLRANYLYLAGYRNIAIITFTRALREFIASGAQQYDFPASKIWTCNQWQKDILRQYGVNVHLPGNFRGDRNALSSALTSLIESEHISNIFDAVLLDEAQDYSSSEISIFSNLGERFFCVADERQKIYDGELAIDTICEITGEPHILKYHYRNGINICRVADEIAKRWSGYQPLAAGANYAEKENPSTVDCKRCSSVEEQVDEVLSRIETQLTAFPNDLIGILCPKCRGAFKTGHVWAG